MEDALDLMGRGETTWARHKHRMRFYSFTALHFIEQFLHDGVSPFNRVAKPIYFGA